ncbi:haloalkane dehalogenase [Halobacterium sp. KA-6]|uniref:haloalkane dehalogenase n=1 Tax=Halobacterium sp. KA-6 TaxID=2896368 RepID=UPI001E42DB36|nr:haloalkane dehalogenase [Halobacterium sp. KA-6]MCD2204034.1 alpha/beta fold hydrolase [Halobacterium sp. KA-6]
MDTELLRTPSYRFRDLPEFPYTPQYVDVSGAIDAVDCPGLTEALMGYVTAGSGKRTILCLHGEASWSFTYRKMIPILADAGRVIAPDYLGFGRSEKFARMDDHSFQLHRDTIAELVKVLDLQHITLVGHDWGGPFGLGVVMEHPDRFDQFVFLNSTLPDGRYPMSDTFMKWRKFAEETPDLSIGHLIEQGLAVNSDRGYITDLSPEVLAAYEAPFPSPEYKAGPRQFPLMVPTPEHPSPASNPIRRIEDRIPEFDKPAQMLFSKGDPIIPSGRIRLPELFSRTEEHVISNAGHFLQENAGKQVAKHIVRFINDPSV